MFYAIIEQTCIALPLILGAYLTLSLMKLPDFSIESAYLCGAMGAYLAQELSLLSVLSASIAGGMFVALLVGSLNQLLGIPFLLAAIATNGLVHGLAHYFLSSGMASFHSSAEYPLFFYLPFLLLLQPLLRTQWGYSLAIYGNNPLFFQHHGISKRFVLFTGLCVGYGLAGVSGFLFAQSNGFVDTTMNFGIILLCLTTLMLGKLLIQTRLPQIALPLLGVIAFFALQQTLLRLGLNLKYFNAFQALCLVAFLAYGQKRRLFAIDHLGV